MGEGCDMRKQDQVRDLLEITGLWWFGRANVQRRTGDGAVLQRGCQIPLDHDLSSRGVNENRRRLHSGKQRCIKRAFRMKEQPTFSTVFVI